MDKIHREELFRYGKQELQVYDEAFRQYQSRAAYDYYMHDAETKQLNSQLVKFKKLTVESFVLDAVLMPVQDIFKHTSQVFLNKYIMSQTPHFCQLHDQFRLLHKVFFLQGVSVQKFIFNLFEQIDHGSELVQTHWYMINVNFQEALGELLERSLPNLN